MVPHPAVTMTTLEPLLIKKHFVNMHLWNMHIN